MVCRRLSTHQYRKLRPALDAEITQTITDPPPFCHLTVNLGGHRIFRQ
ncbi:hypothetical protein L917_11667 [Phytophthora nicotianae]|uniref:Uncharacterized protein n=4 Tax=Phytophthora nicotianae TaxID=4792 RepID=W2Q0Y5_PHYN3|nr:hypothetical protein PPTG_23391 [Phytophthora nicotianae INRA-310]ETI42751.1 hypothetical protein F443_12177 [Phytophthora nicotianae P1569]ETL89407.1 hypothetical protein L917_11667 [Phytophthora nicotianae]ETO71345.1 hypothetical protein F444_12276 [Phytophthora nicotianae P1976]ETM42661.1 hypothetical protein L914_11730 [Phytophthora nicotianae]ETN05950.1 hypothetical protein PPTG_23391 [Phytophthora nicotianae INRA-310]